MFSFNSYTGEVIVSTSLKSLHQKVIDLALTCTSIENGYQDTNFFSVSFQDACLTTAFDWPSYAAIDVDLYKSTDVPIPSATTVVPNCDPITYKIWEIIPDVGFAGTPLVLFDDIDIYSNGGSPMLNISPYYLDNVGGYTITI